MRLLKRAGDRLVFRMSGQEKKLLEKVLSLYPLKTGETALLSREADPRWEEANQMLDEGLKEHRSELAGWLGRRLCEGRAFERAGTAWRLVLEGEDADRLLRVLNELRVGSWVKLGRPDDLDRLRPDKMPVALAPLHWLMELTGQFQMVLIHALSGGMEPDEPETP
jgi:hypothetical protein